MFNIVITIGCMLLPSALFATPHKGEQAEFVLPSIQLAMTASKPIDIPTDKPTGTSASTHTDPFTDTSTSKPTDTSERVAADLEEEAVTRHNGTVESDSFAFKTVEQLLGSNPIEATLNANQRETVSPELETSNGDTPNFATANESILQRIRGLFSGRNSRSPIREVGYLTDYFARPSADKVARVLSVNDKYALNFDDGELVYFSLPKIGIDSSKKPFKPRFFFQRTPTYFSKNGKVLLPKSTKRYIMEYGINKGSVREANHISVVDDSIILDVKPERLNHVKRTMQAIQVRPEAQKRESLLNLIWRPKTKRNSSWQ